MMRNISTPGKFLLLPVFVGLTVMLAVSLHGIVASQRHANGDGAAPSVRPAAPVGTGDRSGAVRAPDAPSAPMPELMREEADEMAALMRALRDNPNDADNLYKIAEIFIRADDGARAEIFLNRAILSRPADVRARVTLGNLLFKQNKIREAAAVYEELLKISEDPDTLYTLAVIRKYHLNDRPGAETLLRRLLGLNGVPPETLEKAGKELQ
jgi:tetratricopeptide (TPR) repeat protein